MKRIALFVLTLAACAQTPVNIKPPAPPKPAAGTQARQESIVLNAVAIGTDGVVQWTLAGTPVAGTAIRVEYSSSVFGGDRTVTVIPDSALSDANRRVLLITIGTTRADGQPFTAQDVVRITYEVAK